MTPAISPNPVLRIAERNAVEQIGRGCRRAEAGGVFPVRGFVPVVESCTLLKKSQPAQQKPMLVDPEVDPMRKESIRGQHLHDTFECSTQEPSPLFRPGMFLPKEKAECEQPHPATKEVSLGVVGPAVAKITPTDIRCLPQSLSHELFLLCRQFIAQPVVPETECKEHLAALRIDLQRFELRVLRQLHIVKQSADGACAVLRSRFNQVHKSGEENTILPEQTFGSIKRLGLGRFSRLQAPTFEKVNDIFPPGGMCRESL